MPTICKTVMRRVYRSTMIQHSSWRCATKSACALLQVLLMVTFFMLDKTTLCSCFAIVNIDLTGLVTVRLNHNNILAAAASSHPMKDDDTCVTEPHTKLSCRRTVIRNVFRFAVAGMSYNTGAIILNNNHPSNAYAAEVFPFLLADRLSKNKDGTSSSNDVLPVGLLESRVTENVLSPPPYGMEITDIFYPSYFQGVWDVQSTTSDIQAPCGILFFGSNTTYQKAIKEIGTTLQYSSRFVPVGSNNDELSNCIADRDYNVRSIAQAAMGANSVVDVPFVSPNKLTAFVAPIGSPSILKVDLITLLRRQETLSDAQFHCSEVVREIVAPVTSSGRTSSASPEPPMSASTSSTVFKEIETASLYTYDPVRDIITCQQRSASFLLPSQQSMIALKMWEAANGRPVDVRFYTVTYTRKKT